MRRLDSTKDLTVRLRWIANARSCGLTYELRALLRKYPRAMRAIPEAPPKQPVAPGVGEQLKWSPRPSPEDAVRRKHLHSPNLR